MRRNDRRPHRNMMQSIVVKRFTSWTSRDNRIRSVVKLHPVLKPLLSSESALTVRVFHLIWGSFSKRSAFGSVSFSVERDKVRDEGRSR